MWGPGVAVMAAAAGLGLLPGDTVAQENGAVADDGVSIVSLTARMLDYSSDNPAFQLTFQYPEEWRVNEESGSIDSYRQVRLLGPRNPDDTYSAHFVVRASPLLSHGSGSEAAKAFVADYITHLPEDSTIHIQRSRGMGGMAAEEIVVSYNIPTLADKRSGRISVTTQTFVLGRHPFLYEVVYSADTHDYPRYLVFAERLIDSFEFLAPAAGP